MNQTTSVEIAILDASRRNQFEGNFRGAPTGLALPANSPSGTLVMSAGSGSVVRDAANDRSLFVSELLKEMLASGVPAEEVFNRTRMGVLRATQGEQNPSNYSSLNGILPSARRVRRSSRIAEHANHAERFGSRSKPERGNPGRISPTNILRDFMRASRGNN
jgi:hypothetical protein